MRLRPYLGDTVRGIVTVSLSLAGVFVAVSALMFFFRPVCEPILRFALGLFVHGVARGYFVYHPSTYWFWDGFVLFLGIFVLVLGTIFVIIKPAQDRRIDEALLRQTAQSSHGAPLEPQ